MMEPTHCEAAIGQGADLYRELRQWKRSWRQRLSPLPPDGPDLPADGRERRFQRASPLHAYYPLLFRDTFPEVPAEAFRDLALADRLLTEHLLHWDRALDLRETSHPVHLLLAMAELGQSLKRLYRLFPVGHPFWARYHCLETETWNSLRQERLHHLRRLVPFPLRRFRLLAMGKTALLKACTAGLCFLAGRESDLAWLEAALDAHHRGLVFLDDLEDWKEDFLRGNYTFLLTRLLLTTGLAARVRLGASVPLRQVGSLLYGTGLAERQLRLAEKSFREAAAPAGAPRLPCWQAFNLSFAQRSLALRLDFAEIRGRGRRIAAADRPSPAPGPGRGKARRQAAPRPSLPASLPVTDPPIGKGQPQDHPDLVGRGPLPRAAENAVLHGIRFLAGRQQPGGAFTASRSGQAYLNPAGRPEASIAATRLIVESLSCLQHLHPLLNHSIRKAAGWVRGSCRNDEMPWPVAGPGRAPRTRTPAAETRAGLAESLDRACRLPMAPGTHFHPVGTSPNVSQCVPLLLFRLCLSLGSQGVVGYRPQALHRQLLAPYRSSGAWGHPTGTALILASLLVTGYQGPEPRQAAARLYRTQDLDGSWPPNAFLRENGLYLGSREATTAWCVLALFLHRLGTRNPAGEMPGESQTGQTASAARAEGRGRKGTVTAASAKDPGPGGAPESGTSRSGMPGHPLRGLHKRPANPGSEEDSRTPSLKEPGHGGAAHTGASGTIAGPRTNSPEQAGHTLPPDRTEVICQPGIPGRLASVAEALTRRWRAALANQPQAQRGDCLSSPLPATIYLGAWDGLPSSFLARGEPVAVTAVNLRTPLAPPFLSADSRPFAVEVVLALALFLRERTAGASRTGLDWVCAAGVALGVCEGWWPRCPLWRLAGLTVLEWTWCREQEELLRQQWHPFLEEPLPGWLYGLWPPPAPVAAPDTRHGRRGLIYLAHRFFTVLKARSLNPDPTRLLVGDAITLRCELAKAGFRS